MTRREPDRLCSDKAAGQGTAQQRDKNLRNPSVKKVT
jgi:hypothetical protein